MNVQDLGLVVYAHNADAPARPPARAWWEALLNGRAPVGFACAVVLFAPCVAGWPPRVVRSSVLC